jgi:ferredoxin
MDPKSIALIYFSPTKTTQHILEAVAQGIPSPVITHHDLTTPETATQDLSEFANTLAIIGTPVYGGRIPLEAVRRLKRLRASNTPAVVVVVYGNRAYEDALLELRDLAITIGFTPIAGGAFIGEHAFSTETTPIAPGRPDPTDLQCAQAFGQAIHRKLQTISNLPEIVPVEVPGNHPYKERRARTTISALITHEDDCTLCGTCARVCPVHAITVDTHVTTHGAACIHCCACVKACPSQARVVEHPRIKEIREWLYTNYSTRQEPETYL